MKTLSVRPLKTEERNWSYWGSSAPLPSRQRETIGETDCLGVTEVNTASLPRHMQIPLNAGNIAPRLLKAMSSLLCVTFSQALSQSLHEFHPLQMLLSLSCALSLPVVSQAIKSLCLSPAYFSFSISLSMTTLSSQTGFPSRPLRSVCSQYKICFYIHLCTW